MKARELAAKKKKLIEREEKREAKRKEQQEKKRKMEEKKRAKQKKSAGAKTNKRKSKNGQNWRQTLEFESSDTTENTWKVCFVHEEDSENMDWVMCDGCGSGYEHNRQ